MAEDHAHGAQQNGGEADSAGAHEMHGNHGEVHAQPDSSEHAMSRDHMGHGDHAAQFRSRFWLALVLSIPVVAYSDLIEAWFGVRPPAFPFSDLIPPVLGTFIFFYGGWVFLKGGLEEIRARKPAMMLLISLAISVAWLASLGGAVGLLPLQFWWEVATLIVVMLFGHWQEMRALGETRGALASLAELIPAVAERLTSNGAAEIIPIGALEIGDTVLVRPGARVPADGVIVDSAAELDESLITGETRPVAREPGEKAVAGSIAVGSSVRVQVGAVGENTTVAGIQRMVTEAQASRSRAQTLADRAAAVLFYVAVGTGLATFAAWGALGQFEQATIRAITVLVIACPHALGLAIPLVIGLSTGIAARQGILVKERLALERMRLIDAVLFDKTGTLTKGEPVLAGIAPAEDGDRMSADELLEIAGIAESESEHPLARAIVAAAAKGGSLPTAQEFTALPGRGVQARINGEEVAVGGPALLRERGLEIPQGIADQTSGWDSRGASIGTYSEF